MNQSPLPSNHPRSRAQVRPSDAVLPFSRPSLPIVRTNVDPQTVFVGVMANLPTSGTEVCCSVLGTVSLSQSLFTSVSM